MSEKPRSQFKPGFLSIFLSFILLTAIVGNQIKDWNRLDKKVSVATGLQLAPIHERIWHRLKTRGVQTKLHPNMYVTFREDTEFDYLKVDDKDEDYHSFSNEFHRAPDQPEIYSAFFLENSKKCVGRRTLDYQFKTESIELLVKFALVEEKLTAEAAEFNKIELEIPTVTVPGSRVQRSAPEQALYDQLRFDKVLINPQTSKLYRVTNLRQLFQSLKAAGFYEAGD